MFIIAEIFPQHRGRLDVAEQMILQCKLAGADAVKVQLYPGAMFPTAEGKPRDYLELSRDELVRLKTYADRIGIDLFATAFDRERLAWCLDLGFQYLKVAARMHREQPALVDAILEAGIPTFVSVPADFPVDDLVRAEHATYLFCVAKYPTRLDEIRLPDFARGPFQGFSDHTLGIAAALLAAAHGARVIEKHYTLDREQQVATELAHLGAMTMDDLRLLRTLTGQFEILQPPARDATAASTHG